MSSYYFKIEIYGLDSFGCPEFNLMGYVSLNELMDDCWDYYYKNNSSTKTTKKEINKEIEDMKRKIDPDGFAEKYNLRGYESNSSSKTSTEERA